MMKVFTKKVLLACIAFLLVMLAAGAALGQTVEEEIEALCSESPQVIEFWHGFRSGAPREALENLTLEFDRANSGRVCVRPVGQGSYRDLSTKILAASAAGELPTLAQGFENNIATYLAAGVVTDLESIGVSAAGLYDNFVEAVRWDGTLYGIPFNKSVHVLYYNRDLMLESAEVLAEAGISENEDGVRVPTTVDEFIAAATALTSLHGEPVYWFRPSDLATYEDWFWTLGGSYFDDAGNLTLNSETGVEALELLVGFVHDLGIARPITDGSFINENFATGVFGFATDTTAGYRFYLRAAEFDVGLATIPGQNPGTVGASVFQGTNILVFNTASSEDQSAAAEYINFLIAPQINAVFATATGYAPLGSAAASEPEFELYLDDNPDFTAIIDQLPAARFEPNLPEWEQIRFDILGQAVVKAVLQEATPQEALDEAQAATEALLAGETR
jgi:ABC-type glycerol-3-phosphate transport system substrate-binding protein